MKYWTDAEINKNLLKDGHHEHNDCVRIAGEWLDRQKWTSTLSRVQHPLKHIIEEWGKRYVSADDVQVAARMLGLKGNYPFFNISSRLTHPPEERLEGIGEAGKHPTYG